MTIVGFFIFLSGFIVFFFMPLKFSWVGIIVSAIGLLLIVKKGWHYGSFWKSNHSIGVFLCFLGFSLIMLFTGEDDGISQIATVGVMLFILGYVMMMTYMFGGGFIRDEKEYKDSLTSKQPWEK